MVLVLSTGVGLTASGLWRGDGWKHPYYSGDALFILSQMRAFAQGEIQPIVQKVVPSLNAPLGANWNDIPISNELLYWVLGLVSRSLGPTTTCHLAVLVAHALAAVAFFVACRLLRYDRGFSLLGGHLFAFSSYLYTRGFGHLVLTYCWHLPLCILVTWWCGSRSKLEYSSYKFWVALGVALLTGVQNPYYLNIFLQLLALAAISLALRKRWRNLIPVLAITLSAVLGFLIIHADTLSYRWQHGTNDNALVRPLVGYERLSLVPIRMFLPYTHRWEPWERFTDERYDSRLAFYTKEQGGTYLGMIGIGGLLWLFVSSLRHVLLGQAQRVPVHAWQILWVLLYSICGGLNWMLAVFSGVFLFRGGNRYSIVILVLVLLFLVRELSRRVRWRWFVVLLAVLVTGVGLWDSLTPKTARDIRVPEGGRVKLAEDKNFVAKAEALLPPGAMLFDFPVCGFPEAGVHGKLCYDYLRPYLHSRSLRFSFGSHKGRPLDTWQRNLEFLPLPMAVQALERLGFAAILVHTEYLEDRGRDVLDRLAEIDRPVVLRSEPSGLVLVRLQPPGDVTPLVVSLGDGWLRSPRREQMVWRRGRAQWSSGTAELVVVNGGDEPVEALLRFGLVTRRPQRVLMSLGDDVLRDVTLRPGSPPEMQQMTLVARPGNTRLLLDSRSSGGARGSANDGAALPFGIVRLEVLARGPVGEPTRAARADRVSVDAGPSTHQIVGFEESQEPLLELSTSEPLHGLDRPLRELPAPRLPVALDQSPGEGGELAGVGEQESVLTMLDDFELTRLCDHHRNAARAHRLTGGDAEVLQLVRLAALALPPAGSVPKDRSPPVLLDQADKR